MTDDEHAPTAGAGGARRERHARHPAAAAQPAGHHRQSNDLAGHGHDGHEEHQKDGGHEGHGGHSHGVSANADLRYLWTALGLMAAFMIGEVVVAFVSGSLVLLSDAGHMLSDVGAIGASLWAINLAARLATCAWTFGWKRAEILSAAGNGITLLVVSGIVAFEAIRRLIHPPTVEGLPVLIVGGTGGPQERSRLCLAHRAHPTAASTSPSPIKARSAVASDRA